MALTAKEAKELKQLKNINSPVPSQRKRILQLQQFKNIKRREIPKKPKVTAITNEYPEGNFGKPSTKKINNKVNKKTKPTTSSSLDFLTPKGRKQFNSISSKLKKMIGPKERITSTKIKENLPKDETYSKKQIEQLRVALTPPAQNSDDGFGKKKKPAQNSTDGFPRSKKPAQNSDDGFGKKKKPAQNSTDGFPKPKNIKIPKGSTLSGLAKKYGTTVKNLMSLNPQIKNADKIYAGRDLNVGANTKVKKPTSVKKPKTINSPTSKEKDAGAGKFTGKTPGYTPRGNKESMNRTKETKKAAPKKESFLGFEKVSGPKGMFIAPAGVRKMKTPFGGTIEVDSTPLKDREDRKAGGKVSKKKGGMIKRSMGGPAKPRKKTVFRRGGGKALRGMGKAIYSNKMY